MSTKRIIITVLCLVALVTSLWQKETLSVLANRLLATERVTVQEEKPEAEIEAIKILEIQETADFSLTLPVVAENNEAEMQPVRFFYQGQQVETEEMPTLQPVEVHQYTWEEFVQADIQFSDFQGLVLGEFQHPLALSWQQADELSQLSQQSWLIYATAETLQVDTPLTMQEPTTDLNLIVQMIETKQVPKLHFLNLPQYVAGKTTQPIYFQALVEHTNTQAVGTLTVTIKDGNTTLKTETLQGVTANTIINLDYKAIAVTSQSGSIAIVLTAVMNGQTVTETKLIPIVTKDYVIIHEKLEPLSDEGYLLGDELIVKRNVHVLAPNQSEKICKITSTLKIENVLLQKQEETFGDVNMDKIAGILAARPDYKLTLPDNINLDKQPVIITSEVTVEAAKGNCGNNKIVYTGTGSSLIKSRKGELKFEFVDEQTQQLITQPYQVTINADKSSSENTQNNTTGQMVFGPLKTANADQYQAKLVIPPAVMLRYRELLKTEVLNSDNSVGALPGQLKYSNPVITVRYHFGPINPLVGAINLGLDNNQFQLQNHASLTVAANSFLTLGAEFTLKEKPDRIIISTPQQGKQPVVYQKTKDGLHVPLTSLNLIDWTYDGEAKQWQGIPNLSFYATFRNIKNQPETFFIRWSLEMPTHATQTGIQIEPGPSETHQRILPLIPYTEAENQGSKTLPDLF